MKKELMIAVAIFTICGILIGVMIYAAVNDKPEPIYAKDITELEYIMLFTADKSVIIQQDAAMLEMILSVKGSCKIISGEYNITRNELTTWKNTSDTIVDVWVVTFK